MKIELGEAVRVGDRFVLRTGRLGEVVSVRNGYVTYRSVNQRTGKPWQGVKDTTEVYVRNHRKP